MRDSAYIKSIFYLAEGAALQSKNEENFANPRHRESDFGANASWQYFATSHGKDPCDDVGGTLERLAAKASLQRPFEGPSKLHNWAQENAKNMTPICVAQKDIRAHDILLLSTGTRLQCLAQEHVIAWPLSQYVRQLQCRRL